MFGKGGSKGNGKAEKLQQQQIQQNIEMQKKQEAEAKQTKEKADAEKKRAQQLQAEDIREASRRANMGALANILSTRNKDRLGG